MDKVAQAKQLKALSLAEVQALNSLGFLILHSLDTATSVPSEHVLSPVSLAALLALCCEDSDSSSPLPIELQKLLGQTNGEGLTPSKILQHFKEISSTAIETPACQYASCIGVFSSAGLVDSYVNRSASKYHIALSKAAAIDKQEVNGWLSLQTQGRNEATVASLPVNYGVLGAVASTAKLELQPRFTTLGPFTTEEGEYSLVAKLQLMHPLVTGGGYAQNSQCQAIAVPFEQSKLRLVLILPRKHSSVTQTLAELSDPAKSLVFSPAAVHVSLPVFSLEGPGMGLAECLQRLGLCDWFKWSEHWNHATTGTARLHDVIQQACFTVRSQEALPSSTFARQALAAASPTTKFLDMKRPFLFALEHAPSKTLLTLGVARRLVPPAWAHELPRAPQDMMRVLTAEASGGVVAPDCTSPPASENSGTSSHHADSAPAIMAAPRKSMSGLAWAAWEAMSKVIPMSSGLSPASTPRSSLDIIAPRAQSGSSSHRRSQELPSGAISPIGAPRHLGITCEGCKHALMTDVRYKCLMCSDLDLCSHCESMLGRGLHHDPTHVFAKLRYPTHTHRYAQFRHQTVGRSRSVDGGQIFIKPCSCCNLTISGVRYQCLTCASFNLCDTCEQQGVKTHHHPPSHVLAKFYDVTAQLAPADLHPEFRQAVAAVADINNPTTVMYHYVACAVCQHPIVGVRYRCLSCRDFDMCPGCEAKGPGLHGHDPSHAFAKLRRDIKEYSALVPQPFLDIKVQQVHDAWCDHCHAAIVGWRFKCSLCPNFDLCGACEAMNTNGKVHDTKHPMLKLNKPATHYGRNKAVANRTNWQHRHTCTRCGIEPIVGVRYQCSVCADVTFCEVCEAFYGHDDGRHAMYKICAPSAAVGKH